MVAGVRFRPAEGEQRYDTNAELDSGNRPAGLDRKSISFFHEPC
jgi:hypothetical protein